MRRSYISPEFYSSKTYGSFNSFEESNFFGSKMLEIEDSINIIDQNIIYYQSNNNEQIDINLETTQNSVIYSSFDSKNLNHSIKIDDSQPDSQRKTNTKWILDINIKDILTDFIFASIKRERTFQGLTNNIVVSKDVNVYIRSYIVNNVLNRYKLSSIDLLLDYVDINVSNNLQYQPVFDKRTFTKTTRFQTETKFDGSSVRCMFNQEKSSQDYSFKYFFNLLFEKI